MMTVSPRPATIAPATDVHAPRGTLHALRIRAEQVQTLFRHFPAILLASIFAAGFLIVMTWGMVPKRGVVAWMIAFFLIFFARAVLYLLFRRIRPKPEHSEHWAWLFTLGSLTSGCLWGASAIVMFVQDSVPYQTILIAVLLGVVTGAMPLTAYAPAFYCFAFPILTVLVVHLLAAGDSMHNFMAVGLVVFALVVLVFGRNFSRLTWQSLAMRYENMDLIEALTREKADAEGARQAAEAANSAKSRFLAAASHDLRQPLHALGLFAAALTEKIKYPEVRAIVNNINASVEALENLFNELLDISKLDAGVIKPSFSVFPVQAVLERLQTDYEPEALEKGLKFRTVCTSATVYSDPTLLTRILGNFVSNAIRYTSRGGVVVGCRRRSQFVRIEVWDTGVGVAEEQQEKIFEEFYQVGNPERDRTKGLGLGLAIVKRLEQLLGYKIGVASRVGGGSVFSVEVPRAEQPTLPEKSPWGPGTAAGLTGRVIVVIDDERAVRDAMCTLLSQWGCCHVASANAEEALAELRARNLRPDLVIADYRLHDGGTGVQAIERLRAALGVHLPGILITGDVAPDHLREASASGHPLLHKPVAAGTLHSTLDSVLSESLSSLR